MEMLAKSPPENDEFMTWSSSKNSLHYPPAHSSLSSSVPHRESLSPEFNDFVQEVLSSILWILSDHSHLGLSRERDYAQAVWKISLNEEVDMLLVESGHENWDSEGALPLSRETVDFAKKVIDKFPNNIDKPDAHVTARGKITFSWVANQNAMFSITIGSSEEIVFAGLFQDIRINGSETWTGVMPKFVDCCFERLREA